MENMYYNRNLYVAAWLKSKGFEIKKITEENGKVAFWFDKSEELFKAVKEYRQSKELDNFVGQIYEVRKLMWEKKKEVENE